MTSRSFIQNAATSRADNGAEMSRLEASLGLLVTNQANLEAARSRLDGCGYRYGEHALREAQHPRTEFCSHAGSGQWCAQCGPATPRLIDRTLISQPLHASSVHDGVSCSHPVGA